MAIANIINSGSATSNNVLISGGSAAPATFDSSGSVGGLSLITSYSPVAQNAVLMTDVVTNEFHSYKIVISGLSVSTVGNGVNMNFSIDNGTTWDVATTSYLYCRNIHALSNTTAAVTTFNNTGNIQIIPTTNMTNSSAIIDIINPAISGVNDSIMCFFTSQYFTTTPTNNLVWGTGLYKPVGPVNAFRVLAGGGALMTGTIKLYGYRN